MAITATDISSLGTAGTFVKAGACSATLMTVLDRAFGHPMQEEETASNPLAGGIVSHGYQCGMLWGAALAAGAEAYRVHGPGPKAEAAAMVAAERLVEAFDAQNGETNCLELTDLDVRNDKWSLMKYFVTGGPIACGRMAVRFAPIAFDEITAAMAEEPPLVPSPCASCAAKVAREMGASEQHVVMAAGLAGGIGLSGGGCGALGAAVWLTAMSNPDEKIGLSAEGTKVGELLDTFLRSSDHELECSEIVGRSFEDTADHARHVGDGGCARIIEALVATSSAGQANPGADRERAA